MEAILKFNLPDEQSDFESAVNGYKWQLAMWELDRYLRTNTKYASDETPEHTIDALEKTRDELSRILNNYNLSFD
jgi:hypothetical protein